MFSLQWSDETLPIILHSTKYPNVQTHRELKEKLYYDIIDYFDKGQVKHTCIFWYIMYVQNDFTKTGTEF